MVVIAYGLLGIVAGVLAGLFGVGGGTIIVPALLVCLGMQGVAADVQMHIAVGTSLASIVLTSISATWTHHQIRAVRWSLVAWIAPGLCVGVWAGAAVAAWLPGHTLQWLFGVFALVIAVQMGTGWQPAAIQQLPGRIGLGVAGSVIGWVSAFFGIGGGSLTVPFLSACRVRMQEAVATASACGFPIALTGALAYAYQGWHHAELPAYSFGFVYLPALGGIALTSLPAARLGARLAHRWSAHILKRCFAVFLLLIALLFLLQSFI